MIWFFESIVWRYLRGHHESITRVSETPNVLAMSLSVSLSVGWRAYLRCCSENLFLGLRSSSQISACCFDMEAAGSGEALAAEAAAAPPRDVRPRPRCCCCSRPILLNESESEMSESDRTGRRDGAAVHYGERAIARMNE